ncbi:MAG: Asp-tRNA(Asn)/Glu-tRNA(Gln) amidotransferase subunit GatB [Oscillospiraceae bacterium]|nr:Asp-tRNA(Asn)/Glu-tRNA(Gln) amidotransferase subunit GatB [Oscillospiraceae bacterium]
MEYETIVGLEVHAELNTKTKIYCNCKNAFGLEVNTQICPICTGMPGTLPTLNEKVVEYAVKMGHATNCSINNVCKQDRKNYFYPDLPKAYQISQADIPLCEHGYVDIMLNGEEKRIGITRIHIEEDAGKMLHNDAFQGSLVDFNRCGVPLIEIVSEPDMRSSAEAKAYLDTLKSILQYIDISDCKMEQGSIRCDVNVSVRPKGSTEFGKRVEMKNVNSFSGAMRAIDYEANRQIEALERGEEINQETRRWDDQKGVNVLLRTKEDAQDYRYFPEPDLSTIYVPIEKVEALKSEIPELPNAKIKRYVKELGLNQTDAELIAENLPRCRLFDECIKICGYFGKDSVSPKNLSNWILGDVSKYMNETGKDIAETPLDANLLCKIVELIETKVISNTSGKIIFEEIIAGNTDIDKIIEEKGLKQISDDSAIEKIVNDVLAANQKSVDDYRGGKTNALGFLVGQCMKASKGQANPAKCKELVLKYLNG